MTLQREARALGDPTRHAVFRYLAEAGRGVGVAELTSHFGLNHNAIRQHLAKLVDAGLVVEETARRSGPGRPRLVYRTDPATDSRWGVMGPYERLSLLLAEVVRTGDTPVEVGRRAGRRMRLRPARSEPGDGRGDGADPLAELAEVMARQGFEPSVHDHGHEIEMDLRRCPFATTALADPDSVCAIHLGMAQGAAERAGGLVVDELIPNDPRQGHCRLRLHRAAVPPAPAED